MSNHDRFALVLTTDALRGALSKLHSAYAERMDSSEWLTGHFWWGLFCRVAMDEPHLLEALRCVRSVRCARSWCGGARTEGEEVEISCRAFKCTVTVIPDKILTI